MPEKHQIPSRFGVHAPMAGGLMKSLQWAVDAGCNALQLFSGNPTAWVGIPWKQELCDQFDAERRARDITPCVLHTPYLINLASPDDGIWMKSRKMLEDAINQARRAGSEYVNSHIGSHMGSGMEAGMARVIEALETVLEADDSDVVVLLETTNGSGRLVGSRFEELAEILNALPHLTHRLGVCIDTAHIWATGYDISTAKATRAVLKEFDNLVGLDRLKCIHANDNRRALGGHSDVHEDIGEGMIGPAAFKVLVNDVRLAHVPFILETPKKNPQDDRRNLERIRSYQNQR